MASKTRAPKRQDFLHGALLLTCGVLAVKIIGALYKIPLSAVLGEDGMGFFSTAYSFYNVLFSIATVGLPVAVSRMVAELAAHGRWRDVRGVKRAAVPLFFAVGAVGCALTVLLAPHYTALVGNDGALPAMLALAPAVVFCAVASAYRGYYEGQCSMVPTMLSQLTEAMAKLLLGLSGAYAVSRLCTEEFARSGTVWGVSYTAQAAAQRIVSLTAAAAICGVTLGAGLSLLMLVLYDLRHRGGVEKALLQTAPPAAPRVRIVKTLCKTAMPVALGAVVTSISGLLDASFLQTRLMAVMRESPAPLLSLYAGKIPEQNLASPETVPNYLFGCYNMALTVFLLVPGLTQAIATSALPSVTRAWAVGRAALSKAINSVLTVTVTLALPAGVGLCVLAEPIARFLYGDGMGTAIIAPLLAVMGTGAVFAALSLPLSGMLQAVGHTELPVMLLLGGQLLKAGMIFVLAGVPEINLYAGAASTPVCYGLVSMAELFCLCRITHVKPDVKAVFLKPAAASAVCGAAALCTLRAVETVTGGARLDVLPAVFAGALGYGVSLLLLGVSRKNKGKKPLFSRNSAITREIS